MKKDQILRLAVLVGLCAVIGFLLPQQFSRVQKFQSLFIQADEQASLYEECTVVARGAYPGAIDYAPQRCGSIARARDAYEGMSFPEAKEAFHQDLLRDRMVFSAIAGGLGLFSYLAIHLLAGIGSARRLPGRGVSAANPERSMPTIA